MIFRSANIHKVKISTLKTTKRGNHKAQVLKQVFADSTSETNQQFNCLVTSNYKDMDIQKSNKNTLFY